MFCYKCQQDSYTRLCNVEGICAKDPACVAVEEFFFQGLKSLSLYANKISEYTTVPSSFFDVIIYVLFSSIQNIQIDKQEIIKILEQLEFTREELRLRYKELLKQRGFQFEILESSASWQPDYNINEMIKQGERAISLRHRVYDYSESCLHDLLVMALRGIIKSVVQAKFLGIENQKINNFFYKTLFDLSKDLKKEDLVKMIAECGKINLIAMGDLEKGLEARYGAYENVKVKTSAVKGNSILVSGRDIRDLENILMYTQAKKINIYTHGEMLLAHSLPELRKFPNLVGHYGGVSPDQQIEIESFPGPVLITSNCAWNPPQVFRGRIFTTGLPIWMGVQQIIDNDFSPLVNAALDTEGFPEDAEENLIDVGFDLVKFNENMNKIKEGMQKNLIKKVFILVGCSNPHMKMDYINEFIENIPEDSILIKFSGLYYKDIGDVGQINGVPRILDFGLYNDLFFVLKFFQNGGKLVNESFAADKLAMVFFLRDQHAVSILLSILTMDSKTHGAKIDTCVPSMLSPVIFKALEENFNIKKIKTAKEDIEEFMS